MQIPTIIQKINNRLGLVTPRLIKKKPLFLIKILFRALSQRFWKTKQLRSILFHTHYKCNFNCKHCYEKNFNRTNEKPLTLTEKKKIIADCLKLGIVSFDFVSGESVLDPELPELLPECEMCSPANGWCKRHCAGGRCGIDAPVRQNLRSCWALH